MKKIFSVEQIRRADAYTIEHKAISSIDLMEKAAGECALWLKYRAGKNQEYAIFAGPGNNGGDGLAIARMLLESGFLVQVYVLKTSSAFSPDFSINLERLEKITPVNIWEKSPNQWPELSPNCILIDAVFGSGLSKPLTGLPLKVVNWMNSCPNVKIAIDIPSGLFADKAVDDLSENILHADYTLSFQFVKFAFLMPENEFFVGEWHILDIGLAEDFIETEPTNTFIIGREIVKRILQKRHKFSHKGDFGHALIIAGDSTKMGAGLLSSKACIKSGAGLVTLHHPKNQGFAVNAHMPEVMLSADESELAFTTLPSLDAFNCIAVGPGLGQLKETQKALKLLIQQADVPIVFDADALNILSNNKTWLAFLRPHSIFTPHVKEFERVAGKSVNSFERLNKAIEFSHKYNVVLVLKGAYTWIVTPSGQVYFNSTGNSGMATGGSGDVLTGIIASLLAQKYSSVNACILGVYLHGLAGDIAAESTGLESLIASDIINNLGKAFKSLY